jgi:hypothetical protein
MRIEWKSLVLGIIIGAAITLFLLYYMPLFTIPRIIGP